MPIANLHCVNVIEPRRPGCRTHSVRLVLVSASSGPEALRKVACSLSEYDGDCRVQYRNSFCEAADSDTLTWTHQTWSRSDADGVGTLVSELRQGPAEGARKAAPDLLAALRQIEAATADGGTLNTIARAAIAKATQEA